tara:strand:+ start:169 stop:306 length:138 start_codon:yes stop_codon:yes gene_type:complete
MNITSIGITLISILIAIAIAVAGTSFLIYLLLTIFAWIETKKWRW